MIQVIVRPITKNPAYIRNVQRADARYVEFQERGPLGAVLHSIGTPQPSARVIAENFDRADAEASVHMVLQADGVCYQLAPDNYRMWHVGGAANQTHIGIEMTEPAGILYDDRYRVHIVNHADALRHVRETYARAVELFARLCRQYGWDPLEDGVIMSHAEAYARGLGSNHGDPEHLWDALKTGYTMDTFRAAVAEELKRKEGNEVRYQTVADLKRDVNAQVYLPTVEKLLRKGFLAGKGGSGDVLILDLSEDSVRLLVMLDRAGMFGE